MKKSAFLNSVVSMIAAAAALMTIPSGIIAAEPAVADECSRELLLSYFPEAFVNETLKRFNVPAEKWTAINKALTEKDKEIVKLVEEKASAMSPNPLKDPQQRQIAVKIFRETLLQVFAQALKDNGVADSGQFQTMLDDIQQQKAKKFAQCMEREKQKILQQTSAGNESDDRDSDEDSDDDDDDSDDDDDDSDDEDNDDDKNSDGDKAKTAPASVKGK